MPGLPENPCAAKTFGIDLAEWTGLEPATPGVTGRYSNQLNYHSMRAGLVDIVKRTHGARRLS